MGAFLFLLIGYSGIRHFYNSVDATAAENLARQAVEDEAEKLSFFSFCILVLCSYLTGAGGNGGLTSSVNATAKSFPDRMVRAALP